MMGGGGGGGDKLKDKWDWGGDEGEEWGKGSEGGGATWFHMDGHLAVLVNNLTFTFGFNWLKD